MSGQAMIRAIRVLAIGPVPLEAPVNLGSDSTKLVCTTKHPRPQQWVDVGQFDWKEYGLVGLSPDDIGDINVGIQDTEIIWSSQRIDLGKVTLKDGSTLGVFQTTPKVAQEMVEKVPSTPSTKQAKSDDWSYWAIRRIGSESA